jgi:anthranilate phosphoribosyltransferase
MLETILKEIQKGENLSVEKASECLNLMLQESANDDMRVAIMAALADKGETADEISGFAKVLTKHLIPTPISREAVDLCGTGGSGLIRYNISTTVAFVLASGGFPVAKHGNRGSKTNNGSFDLLETLGIDIEISPEQEKELFKEYQLCFLFARAHHPAMKTLGPARVKLGRRSVFNLIGPLCNPASVDYQIVGVSDPALGPKMIEVMKQLNKKRALVIWGEPGIDECSTCGDSKVWLLDEGEVSEFKIDLEDLGIPKADFEKFPRGDCMDNAETFYRLLNGEPCEGLLDMVALNAGAAIFVMEKADSIKMGYQMAKELLLSGKTKTYFETYPKIK